ncbi:MAG: outer membrane beta-barrel protein [Candidatus Glassbacteria bacterium]
MNRLYSILLTGLLLTPSYSLARLEAGGGLSLAWPQGDFKQQVDFAWGGAGRAGWTFGSQPAAAATVFFDFNYLNYGRERRVEPFSTTIPDVVVNVVTDNFMILVSPGLAFGVGRGPVRPYGEVFGGMTYIATSTRIENRGLASETIAESTNFDDFTYNVGAGAGLKILVWKKDLDVKYPELREALIDIKLSYVKGGQAEYLKKGSIRRSGGRVEYDTVQSSIDLMRLRLGVSLSF